MKMYTCIKSFKTAFLVIKQQNALKSKKIRTGFWQEKNQATEWFYATMKLNWLLERKY